MPSPFPGMDPFLEGELWQEFHGTLCGEIRAQLLPKLAPRYVALLAKRYVLDTNALGLFDLPRSFYPDVHVVEQRMIREAPASETLVATPASMDALNPTPIPQYSIEIRDIAERRLITVIELLSPSNKHGDGAREYRDRRTNLLQTTTHLLEIDLLRSGTRIAIDGRLPIASYYVYLTRAESRHAIKVWANQLAERLPVVPVPLLQPDPDVLLDLQAAVAACFALVGYERLIDYQAELPPPPLSATEQAWVAGRVATAKSW